MKTLFIFIQHLVPQHLLSRLVGKIAATRVPWVKNRVIQAFVKHFAVDMSEAEQPDPTAYPTFNAFFTRSLAPRARIISQGNTIASPADGAISQLGQIENGRVFQAKGHYFSTQELLGGDSDLALEFDEGSFATIYLSPRDYHRVHMPCEGVLRQTVYIPGDLFSVNQTTAERVPRLFARNERLVSVFDTPQGPMASVMVGAMIVAGIETVWAGQTTPPQRAVHTTYYNPPPNVVKLAKGDEMGRFLLGSTVVLLFPKNTIRWRAEFGPNSSVQMGQALADIKN
jgi:phosphatidylserine decarboxylase